jgi:antirestriction protein ArdC
MSSFDLYQTVTDKIISMLETGVVPWRSPILGGSKGGHPKNLNTGKKYRGVNVFLLAFTAYAQGYGSSYWLTFNQAKERGVSVKKGEKSSLVVFWKQYETTDKETGQPTTLPVLRYYNVFNAEQVEGAEIPDAIPFTPTEVRPIEAANAIAGGFVNGPKVHFGDNKAYYLISDDSVHLPDPQRFVSSEAYYATLFHELSHSTGHPTRLKREFGTSYDSELYSKEELVAEMSAAFLCGHAGIEPAIIENQAAYINGWLKRLKSDKKLIVSAAAQAQRSADWILGERGAPE